MIYNFIFNSLLSFSKKTLFLILIILFKTFYCFPHFNLSLTSSAGFKSTITNEYVYENDNNISLLKWELPAIPLVSILAEIEFNNFFITTEYESAIPIKLGKMKDFDYLTVIPNVVSHYSEHDIYLDKDFSLNEIFGYKIRIKKRFQMIPFVGFSYQNKKYTAQNGYLQYPLISGEPWSGEEKKTVLSGIVISYEQAILFPFSGIKLLITLNEFIEIGINGVYYPYINICSIDSHFLRMIQFYDKMNSSNGGRLEIISMIYPFKKHKNMRIMNRISYEYLNCYGKTSSSKIGLDSVGFVDSYNASAKIQSQNILISIGLSFIY